MVDRAELEAIANAMVEDGEVPAIRSVRARLPGGGSHRVIGLLLSDWRAKREGVPRATRKDLAPWLLDKLVDAAVAIWADGRRQGLIAGENERRRLTDRVEALEVAFVQAAALADGLDERPAARNKEGRAETEEPKAGQGRPEALKVWAEVIDEIEGLLVGGNRLTAGEIIRRLSPTYLKRVPALAGEAKEARLGYKLIHRKRRGANVFIKDAQERFALRAEIEVAGPEAGANAPVSSDGDGNDTQEDAPNETPGLLSQSAVDDGAGGRMGMPDEKKGKAGTGTKASSGKPGRNRDKAEPETGGNA